MSFVRIQAKYIVTQCEIFIYLSIYIYIYYHLLLGAKFEIVEALTEFLCCIPKWFKFVATTTYRPERLNFRFCVFTTLIAANS